MKNNLVLVLNADFSPLNITSLHRGFVLVDKGKAEVVKKGEKDIVTSLGNFVRPVIIRLLSYIRFRRDGLKVNRRRIFKRDNNTCQYCGSKKNLTIDHVMPRSRGGGKIHGKIWSHVVRDVIHTKVIKHLKKQVSNFLQSQKSLRSFQI